MRINAEKSHVSKETCFTVTCSQNIYWPLGIFIFKLVKGQK